MNTHYDNLNKDFSLLDFQIGQQVNQNQKRDLAGGGCCGERVVVCVGRGCEGFMIRQITFIRIFELL